MNLERHIVVAILLPYSRSGDFWGRDAGLLVRGFRELGCRGTLVAIQGPETIEDLEGYEKEGIALADLQALGTVGWWQKLAPDGVVLFGWTLPRFQMVRDAILRVTPRLIERMDTNGMRCAQLDPAYFFYLMWAESMERMRAPGRYSWKTLPAAVSGFAKTAKSIVGFPIFGRRAARTVSKIPAVLVESPVALERIRRWMRMHRLGAENIHFCPHAVDVESLPGIISGGPRLSRVVAIGRWKSFQKDYENTWRVARDFLCARPDYEFHFIGQNPASIRHVSRVIYRGHVSRQNVGPLLSEAKIHFAASRFESFHLGAAEALCCGCSSVMPASLPTAGWFSESRSGSISRTRGVADLARTLVEESQAWDRGMRNPDQIATHWRGNVSASNIAKAILQIPEFI